MSTGSSDARPAGVLVFAVPPVLVAAAAVLLVVLGAFGRNPFWAPDDLTMAEAAALRDQAAVAVLARAGVDPSARMRVRAGILGNADLELTPAEAAVMADRTEILDVLLANGLRLDPETGGALLCRARASDSEETLRYLEERFPAAVGLPCPD
jgi:hypothetical protein